MNTSLSGKEIAAYKIEGSGGLWGIKFPGARVPDKLKGKYTNENLATQAISGYVASKNKPKKEPAPKKDKE